MHEIGGVEIELLVPNAARIAIRADGNVSGIFGADPGTVKMVVFDWFWACQRWSCDPAAKTTLLPSGVMAAMFVALMA